MAIVDDIRKDARTKNVLAQTNTKTVSAPPSSTGLTGDSLTDEIFSVSDFETVKNQVHLEEKNFQLLEALNTIGQITDKQSQSGPIPGTQTVYAGPTVTDTTRTVLFTPNPGEVWQVLDITATRTNITGTSGIYLYFNDLETSQLIQIFYGSSSSSTFMITDDATWDPHPVYISYPCQMQFTAANSTNWDDCQLQINMIRVR